MTIDPEVEQCFNPQELSREIRRRMKLVRHHKTIHHWMHKGCRKKKTEEERVFLEKINVGGEICSSIEAVKRFFERLGKK